MSKTYKLVAISLVDNKCKQVLVCKNVDDRELAKLRNEEREYEVAKHNDQQELLNRISDLENTIKELQHEINVLKGEEE